MKKPMFVVVLIAGLVASAFAQARPTLGVLPFTGGAEGEGEAIASLFLAQRELRDIFNVVPRNMALSAIFNERQFQLSDLTDPGTIASLNRMFNADYVLAGSITDVGGRNLLIASIIHVESFEQVAGIYITYGSPEEVIGLLPSISARLTNAASRHRPAGRQRLAVVPFAHPATVNAQDAETLAQILAIEVLHTGRYTVVPRLSIIQAALREQGFQMLGYTDDAGMASLGRAMNANLVLGGSISRFGAANFFTSQILNVVDGRVMGADTVQYGLIGEGVEAMGELAVGMTTPPGPQRERALIELGLRQNHPVPVPGANLAAQLQWLRFNMESDTHYIIELSQDVAIGPQSLRQEERNSRGDIVLASSNRRSNNVVVTLRGIGAMRTISLSSDGTLFSMADARGITLVLDENITLQGRSGNSRILVHVTSGNTLIMKEGARIIHNTGGGVNLNSGAFIMLGGEISGNSGARGHNGSGGMNNVGGGGTGGVFIVSWGSRFTMFGGTISGNSGGNGGNGARGGNGFRRNWDGNPGWAGGYGGVGGVFVGEHSTFIMHGGEISGNTGGRGGSGGIGGEGGGGSGRRGANGTAGTAGANNVLNMGTLRITNGVIDGGLIVSGNGTIQYGAYNASGVFSQMGALTTTNGTVRVADGVLQ